MGLKAIRVHASLYIFVIFLASGLLYVKTHPFFFINDMFILCDSYLCEKLLVWTS